MSTTDDLIKSIENNPLLKDYKISSFNCIKAISYLKEKTNCINCNGLIECQNASLGMEPVFDGYDVSYKACEYYKIEKNKKNINFSYMTNFSHNATLDNFIPQTAERKKALDYAKDFIKNIDKNNSKGLKGLYLYGSFGTGKTYFVSAIANELAQKNISSILVFLPDLSRILKNSIEDNTLERKINELKSTTVLILDDFGGEMMSAWLRDEVIAPVLQYRMVNDLPVFITSNLNYDLLKNQLSQTKQEIDDMKAVRIIERLKAMTKRCNLEKKYDSTL